MKLHALLTVATAVALAGCALPQPPAPAAAQAVEVAAPLALGSMRPERYVRVDAERTGVVNAADDGRNTYLAFDRPLKADEVLFFDDEGKSLAFERAGPVAAVAGLHRGVLVRIGQANSFIAPAPRAGLMARPDVTRDPMVVEARDRLDIATTQRPLFARALERADATLAGAAAPGIGPSTLVPVDARASGRVPRHLVPPVPELPAPAPDDPTYQVTADGVMVRIYFASGGRAIVQPDDGLRRLELAAVGAEQIRIAGFTDSVGSDTMNTAIARMRAEAIRSLLVRRGVAPERIFVTWAGNTRYLADNATESGRAMNRRVEVLLVGPPALRAGRPG